LPTSLATQHVPRKSLPVLSLRRALEEAVVTELLEEVSAAAASAARSGRSGLERLNAAFGAISRMNEHRLANDIRLHELVVAAGQANWLASLSHADRLRGVVRSIIAAGQCERGVPGRQPDGARLLSAGRDGCLPQSLPSQGDRASAGVRRDDRFCAGALGNAAFAGPAPPQLINVQAGLRHKSTC
jgi:hypothetical protein